MIWLLLGCAFGYWFIRNIVWSDDARGRFVVLRLPFKFWLTFRRIS